MEADIHAGDAATATALSTPAARVGIGTYAGLFTLVTALFAYGFAVFLRVQPQPSDLTLHIDYARRLQSLSDLTSPHFLFQLLVNAIHVIGASYESSAAWVLGICYGVMALLIAREVEARGARLTSMRAFVVVPALLVASHVFLFTLFKPNLYYGYFAPIVYHNPTQQLNKVFALWIFFVYRSHVLMANKPPASSIPKLAGLCVLSAIAKPSFLLAFVPTAGLHALRDIVRRRWLHVVVAVFGIALPTALILAWQTQSQYASGAQILFAPFTVFNAVETLYKLPASLGFALWVAVAAAILRQWDKSLGFIWVLTALSLLLTVTLVESGQYLFAGNFAWTGQTAVFLVYVESILFLLTRPARAWTRPAWALFAVHVACGIVWYAVMFSAKRPDWL